jgi:hypothetical protein
LEEARAIDPEEILIPRISKADFKPKPREELWVAVSPFDVLALLDQVLYSPIILSLLSAYARQELLHQDFTHTIEATVHKQIIKEFSASQSIGRRQTLSYDGLFGNDITIPLHEYIQKSAPRPDLGIQFWGFSPETYFVWCSDLSALKRRIATSRRIYYPTYQRKKNVGYATQIKLKESPYPTSVFPHITSLDLERHYHMTGEHIDGPMEMRFSWKSSQTKPRVYYAGGGTAYFLARYMRNICNDIAGILPGTNRYTRYSVRRMGTLQDGDALITYDYSSFTTTLSELKYFVHYLAESLRGTSITLCDTHYGVIDMDLGEMFDSYNEGINVNAEFDIHRLQMTSGSVAHLYQQTCSGMLGVAGNINLSMTLHGLNASATSDGNPNCTVGDDGLVKDKEVEVPRIINSINQLCAGVPDKKFHVWLYRVQQLYMDADEQPPASTSEDWCFLKRPLKLQSDGSLLEGILPDFPDLGALLKISMLSDLFNDSLSDGIRFQRFANQLTRFLTRIQHTYEYSMDDHEIILLSQVFSNVYQRFGVPVTGGLPSEITVRDFVIRTFVPPVTYDAFNMPWYTSLLRGKQAIVLPVYKENAAHGGYVYGRGQKWHSFSHAPLKLMVDLGYFRQTILTRLYLASEIDEEFILSILTSQVRQLYEYTCVRDPPEWFNTLMYHDIVPDPIYERDERYAPEMGIDLSDSDVSDYC